MHTLWKKFALGLGLMVLAPMAEAQTRSQVTGDNLTKEAQTFFVRGDVGSSTFESKAAGSKDTHSAVATEIGGWLGESRVAGIRVRNQDDKVPFSLNQSESQSSFTDVRIVGRIWGFLPSAGISLSEVNVKKAETKTIGLFGTGWNAGLGWTGVLYPGINLNADYMVVQSPKVFDKLDQGDKLGARNEGDVHIAFDVTERIVDLLVGYKLRKYEIETPTEKYAESAQGVYAGVRLGVYF